VNPRFAYLHFMKDDPDRVRATVPRHVAHWQRLGLPGYLGGPFEDRTGPCEAVAFPDAIRKRQRPFRVGEIVCVSGQTTLQDDLPVFEVA